jgi:hypothetical protein
MMTGGIGTDSALVIEKRSRHFFTAPALTRVATPANRDDFRLLLQ